MYVIKETKLKEEKSLVERCIVGDRAAEKEFFMRFAPKMKSLCMRFASSADEANDMLQEGFIRVFAKLDKFNHAASIETWLTRLFVNNNISYLRKTKKWRELSSELHDNINPTDEDDDWMVNEEGPEVEEVIELMQQLPVGYRAVINLYAVENMSHKEVAESLGITESTSRSQLLKARRMLKALIEQKYK